MLGRGQRLSFDAPDDGLGVGRHTLTLLGAIALSVLIHFGILLLCAPIRFGGGMPQLQETPSALADLPPLQVTLVSKTAAPAPSEPAAPDPVAAAGQSAQETADRAESAPTQTPPAPALPQLAAAPVPPPPPQLEATEAFTPPPFPGGDGGLHAAPLPAPQLHGRR